MHGSYSGKQLDNIKHVSVYEQWLHKNADLHLVTSNVTWCIVFVTASYYAGWQAPLFNKFVTIEIILPGSVYGPNQWQSY